MAATQDARKEQKRNQLLDLNIRSLGVIEKAEVELSPGLTVLTGETGAGKTMVLTSLQLLLGAKSDVDFIRVGDDRLQVSATFSLDPMMQGLARELECEVEDGNVSLVRTVNRAGRNKITLGGTPITQTQLSSFAENLIEIHAQSSSLRLAKAGEQRYFVDKFAGNSDPNFEKVQSRYKEAFSSYQELANRLAKIKAESDRRDEEIEKLTLFWKAFEALRPEPDEIIRVDQEILALASVEEINESASLILNEFENEEDSVSTHLARIKKNADLLLGKDQQLDNFLNELVDSISNLSEAHRDISSYVARLEANPARFDYLQERKAALNTFIKRFGSGENRIHAYEKLISEGESAKERLKDLEGGDERIAQLEKELAGVGKVLIDLSTDLFTLRKASSEILATKVNEELKALGMAKSKIFIEISMRSDKSKDCDALGNDELKILFQSFPEGPKLPLSKSASGGELSRLSLALDLVAAEGESIGTYIFDEVDSGVGGKTAIDVGLRLWRLSRKAQVIVVTHLAQVAVWADSHYIIHKDESTDIALSTLIPLSHQERVSETARLLSGHESSVSALRHAEELIEEALRIRNAG